MHFYNDNVFYNACNLLFSKQRLAVPVATKLAPRDGMKSKQRYHSAPSYKSPMAAPRPAQVSFPASEFNG